VILLDTHLLAWAVDDSKLRSRTAASAIRRARRAGGVAVAAITVWELASLLAQGKLPVYGNIESSLRLLLEGVTVRPITPEIAALATQFPDDYPRDPADHLIGATARAEGLTLLTRDQRGSGAARFSGRCGDRMSGPKLAPGTRPGGQEGPPRTSLVIVFQPQVGDQFFAFQMAQRVLQLHQLNEQIVLRIEAGGSHRRLKVKA
jgi:PIN domain nuclease of toxin-antitoxin system